MLITELNYISLILLWWLWERRSFSLPFLHVKFFISGCCWWRWQKLSHPMMNILMGSRWRRRWVRSDPISGYRPSALLLFRSDPFTSKKRMTRWWGWGDGGMTWCVPERCRNNGSWIRGARFMRETHHDQQKMFLVRDASLRKQHQLVIININRTSDWTVLSPEHLLERIEGRDISLMISQRSNGYHCDKTWTIWGRKPEKNILGDIKRNGN